MFTSRPTVTAASVSRPTITRAIPPATRIAVLDGSGAGDGTALGIVSRFAVLDGSGVGDGQVSLVVAHLAALVADGTGDGLVTAVVTRLASAAGSGAGDGAVAGRVLHPATATGSGLGAGTATADVTTPNVLGDAVAGWQASSLNSGTYTPGDSIPNEGTAGSGYDIVAVGSSEEDGPELVDSPEPGLVIGGNGSNLGSYIQIPNGAAIDLETGTWAYLVRWTEATGGFDNIMSKITGTAGVDGQGLSCADVAGQSVYGIATNGGTSPGTDPVFALGASGLSIGVHLVVLRFVEGDEITVFIDGVEGTIASLATVASVSSTNPLIFSRGKPQTGLKGYVWARALTDTEITVDLPDALGV